MNFKFNYIFEFACTFHLRVAKIHIVLFINCLCTTIIDRTYISCINHLKYKIINKNTINGFNGSQDRDYSRSLVFAELNLQVSQTMELVDSPQEKQTKKSICVNFKVVYQLNLSLFILPSS